MSQSIDATDRVNLNGHANFDYRTENDGFNTAYKMTKDESSEYEKFNKSAGNQSGLNLDK